MCNPQLNDALNISPNFSGRLVLHFMNGELDSCCQIQPGEFIASLTAFIEVARAAGFAVTPTKKIGE
ncbi:hypothetical protein AV903_15885 [Erwinia tracheiphila]|uniref:Uncharacterized protein n=1 Tax=Erwinia tracheiphila TaxID=65700 RepID=A0A345CUQ5_9GAMM|nr:hypothetical protein AV903_15885 [Erwinia tracheiphila]